MKTISDFTPILDAATETLKQARLESGRYRRWVGPGADQREGGDTANPYGVADAANVLYTLGAFPAEASGRAAFVSELQRWQNPEDGFLAKGRGGHSGLSRRKTPLPPPGGKFPLSIQPRGRPPVLAFPGGDDRQLPTDTERKPSPEPGTGHRFCGSGLGVLPEPRQAIFIRPIPCV
ncbi:MAG: hypothetical protein PF795_08140 [Kiritimatiellae bacterium]|nr:hypothetical protein [Kiritimatiellia bacterium]